MMRTRIAITVALASALALLTACEDQQAAADLTPLPAVAAPPYICDQIPLKAVELMTGVRKPLVRGFFDLSADVGDGSCAVYRRDGDRLKVLQVILTPARVPGEVEEELEGATPLPEIVPGSIGYYFKDPHEETYAAQAVLARGKAELTVQLVYGVKGRDNAADVLALMKLIAPKLITPASAPSPSASASPKGK
ncbi:hypothetical protein ACFY05_28105 [Microtetraspora fusca]|uniref:DUF3558 domain-containing protein n=1 Tax=Microtetraspora fusca TaxID=1997 RepID=A0ABW6VC64_MICFU